LRRSSGSGIESELIQKRRELLSFRLDADRDSDRDPENRKTESEAGSARGRPLKQLIITADDFGLALAVNEAVAEAHERGILTAASLMVGARFARDAVERARKLPSLRVGLHLVLVEGTPVLSPRKIPDLVDGKGSFSRDLVRSGFKFFFRTGIRKQLEAEIRAQFEAFHKTGLPLDHVNAHNHMHLHPTVLRLLLSVGQDYGLKAVRLPNEPPVRCWKASRKFLGSELTSHVFLLPWIKLMKRRLRRAGINFNDHIFGLSDSGAMTLDLVQHFIMNLPEGVTEIYFHPSKRRCPEIDRDMPNYRHEEEFEALTSKSLLETIEAAGMQRIAFGDIERK
jgi:hopanoid biosynthesis associated protein HpnK